jgi:hypothetical protein
MAKRVLDTLKPGRKARVQRFVYRPPQGGKKKRASGAKKGAPARDWDFIKDQLRRTVKRVPEVVIIVDGGGRADKHSGIRNATTDSEGVSKYMLYISRAGKLTACNEQGEQLTGKDAILDTHAAWNLDLQRQVGWVTHRKGGYGGRLEQLHQTFNLIMSMPRGTDPDGLFAAVQAFAREHFADRQYMMVLHTPETDPSPKRAEQPHVHLIIRAENDRGQRIYIRKDGLHAWRESFAQHLRLQGIEANATSRAARGVSLKQPSGPEYHIRRKQGRDPGARGSTALAARLDEAAAELQAGDLAPKPWELAMEYRRRDELRQLRDSVARLRAEGDHALADEVQKFMEKMPPVDTERRQMQRMLVRQVHDRLGKDRGLEEPPK